MLQDTKVQKAFNDKYSDFSLILKKRVEWMQYFSKASYFGLAERTTNNVTNIILPLSLEHENPKAYNWLNEQFLYDNGIYDNIYNAIWQMCATGNSVLFTHENELYSTDIFSSFPIYDGSGKIIQIRVIFGLSAKKDDKGVTIYADKLFDLENETATTEYFSHDEEGLKSLGETDRELYTDIKFNSEPTKDKCWWLKTGIKDTDYIYTPYCKCVFHRTEMIDYIEQVYQTTMEYIDNAMPIIALNKETFKNMKDSNKVGNSLSANTKANGFATRFKCMDVGQELVKQFKFDLNDGPLWNTIKNMLKSYSISSDLSPEFYNLDSSTVNNGGTAMEFKAKQSRHLVRYIWSIRNINSAKIKDALLFVQRLWFENKMHGVTDIYKSIEEIDKLYIDWPEVESTQDEDINIGINMVKQGWYSNETAHIKYGKMTESEAKAEMKKIAEEKITMAPVKAIDVSKPIVNAGGGAEPIKDLTNPTPPSNKNQTQSVMQNRTK